MRIHPNFRQFLDVKDSKGNVIYVNSNNANIIETMTRQLESIREKISNIKEAHIDTLGTEIRDEMLSTNKVFYYKHMSWDFLGHTNDHKKLKEIVDSCLEDNVINPTLKRKKNAWF